jgi:hypothetical protein
MSNIYQCLECGKTLSEGVHIFSTKVHGFPLCLKHQCWIVESSASPEAKAIYFALKHNRIPAVLEYSNGQKTMEVAIPGKLFIELDSCRQQLPEQAFTDLFLDFYSWREQIPTFRIPKSTVNNPIQFKQTVNRLVELCMELKRTG